MFRVVLAGMIIAALLGTAAWADIVHLKGGGRLEGLAEVQGDVVKITGSYGTTSVPLSSIDFIEKNGTALEEYNSLASAAGPRDLQKHRKLAEFCRRNRLSAQERYHLLLVLRFRPDDLDARSRLGFVRHRGQWLAKSEEMYDRGMTRFRGEWTTPADKEATLKQEQERRRELAEKRRREREEKLARLRAERLAQARRERERERAHADVLGINYVDRDNYYRQRYYSPYHGGYSITSPYSWGNHYSPYYNTGWVWYRRWTGSGLSAEYKSRSWRVSWGR